MKLSRIVFWSTLVLGGLFMVQTTVAHERNLLKPYDASYSTRFGGVSFTIQRSLHYNAHQLCVLENEASVLFAGFTESALFSCDKDPLQTRYYRYKNTINKNKNVTIDYAWKNKTATTEQRNKQRTVALTAPSLDKLSLQAQLRIDLMREGQRFTRKSYHLVYPKNIRTFIVEKAGEETITVPAGDFATVKLRKFRAESGGETFIWFAKKHDYFIVRIEDISEDGDRRVVELDSFAWVGE